MHLDQPVTSRSIPAGGYNSAPRGMAPPLPARVPPPVRISNNQQRAYDQVQHQSYPDSTTYRGAEGYGGYRDVTHHYDEDEEGEAVGGFQGEEDHGEGEEEEEDEEAQEQEPEPEYEQEGYYHGGEPVEYEEQGYNAHNAHSYGGYGAGQMVEEGEGEYDGGYRY